MQAWEVLTSRFGQPSLDPPSVKSNGGQWGPKLIVSSTVDLTTTAFAILACAIFPLSEGGGGR